MRCEVLGTIVFGNLDFSTVYKYAESLFVDYWNSHIGVGFDPDSDSSLSETIVRMVHRGYAVDYSRTNLPDDVLLYVVATETMENL